MSNRHPFAEQVDKMQLVNPPSPWKSYRIGIGGLTEVGYATDTDYLMTVSWNGRGVLDCLAEVTLCKIGRDDDMEGFYNELWHDPIHLTAQGIKPIEGQTIHLAGLWGGGLKLQTSDGWRLELVSPNWPLSSIILCPPGCSLNDEGAEQCLKVAPQGGGDEIRAYGFSHTGRSFIVAMSHTIEIFSRPSAES